MDIGTCTCTFMCIHFELILLPCVWSHTSTENIHLYVHVHVPVTGKTYMYMYIY